MGFYASFAEFEADFNADVLFLYIYHFLIQNRVTGGMCEHSLSHTHTHTHTHMHNLKAKLNKL